MARPQPEGGILGWSAIRVARVTGGRVVDVAILARVPVIDIGAWVTARVEAAEDSEVGRVGVAIVALRARVLAAVDWKVGVVEDSLVPTRIRLPVAHLAVGGKARSRVVRTDGAFVVLQMTADAVGREPLIDAARMALGTLDGGVGSNHRIIRECS